MCAYTELCFAGIYFVTQCLVVGEHSAVATNIVSKNFVSRTCFTTNAAIAITGDSDATSELKCILTGHVNCMCKMAAREANLAVSV
jgi:hypothetical protein